MQRTVSPWNKVEATRGESACSLFVAKHRSHSTNVVELPGVLGSRANPHPNEIAIRLVILREPMAGRARRLARDLSAFATN